MLQKISLGEWCVHPQNRAGCFPAAIRIISPLCSVLKDKFLINEAQREAVVVQELPVHEREAYKRLWGKTYTTHMEHNKEHTQNVEVLARAFSSTSTFSYGGLSHCTLCLGLLCMKFGAVWEIPEEHRGQGLEEFQTGPGGSWDLPKMRRVEGFRELLDVIDNGLHCEVLSWEIHFDPDYTDAPGLIAAALNDAQGKGVATHELEILKSVTDYVAAAVAEVRVGEVRT